MSRSKSKRNIAPDGWKTSRSQKAGMKHAEAPPLNGKKKDTCALAGSLEAVNVLIEKHFKAIGEFAVKHCEKANSDPQRSKELNPDDVVRDACEKLTRNWAKVPVEPRFIKYVKALITASPLAGSLEVVQHLIEKNQEAIKRIAAKACRKADMELRHVEGFNASDVTREVSDKLRRNWVKVPVEPGFFKYVKTVVRRHIASLWKKYLRRTNVFTRFEEKSKSEEATPDRRLQGGDYDVELRESLNLLDAACLLLRTKKPRQWRAFELRELKGLKRKTVAEMMEIKRPGTVNDYVDSAKKFLIFVLPARADLV